ncbi:MAG: hypothetical protein ACPHN2_00500 [Sinimarinibacterium flocculans]|uniref:Pentapeptide MXKDX repeat protein n=1 Tax=Sinimarinibacterium flocculans TaxID=985250 RepID=A0A318E613_9GAMM|nr:hypothetical protein [Sinimarinibacterium flocculans]MEC9365283.1 hypothetical protein [Pseudomonadota bacterium]PXV63700.1 hypothetical protein C8D93_1159 [Sinimarinibacterium flocculans]
MNKLIQSTLIAALVLAAQAVAAHDPKEHEKEAAAKNAGPDCAQMKDMDKSKMDMNDPVMKAMHEKCMGQIGHEDMDHTDGESKAPAKADEHKH